jgi:hypothetical protein
VGVTIDEGTIDQVSRLRTIASAARDRAAHAGSVSESQLREWIIVDDMPVHDGMSRIGHEVTIDRILDVADGFLELLDGTLPPDPPDSSWFLGTGSGSRRAL